MGVLVSRILIKWAPCGYHSFLSREAPAASLHLMQSYQPARYVFHAGMDGILDWCDVQILQERINTY